MTKIASSLVGIVVTMLLAAQPSNAAPKSQQITPSSGTALALQELPRAEDLFPTITPSSGTALALRYQIELYEKKILSHGQDLVGVGKALIRSHDATTAVELADIVFMYSIKLDYLQELLSIQLMVQNAADKARIVPIINRRIATISKGVDLSIKEINRSIASVKSQALLATATQFRTDVRALRNLLEDSYLE